MHLGPLERLLSVDDVPNPAFEDMVEHVLGCVWRTSVDGHARLQKKERWEVARYAFGPYRAAYERAREHVAKHGRGISGEHVLVLVHPFYALLSDRRRFSNDVMGRIDGYVDLLVELLSERCVEIAVFDTVHHYATVTSTLLERGFVDQVILTEFDSGKPRNAADLNIFSGKQVFVGGAYNGRCVKSALEYLSAVLPDERLMAVSDLVADRNDHEFWTNPENIIIDARPLPPSRVRRIERTATSSAAS